MAVAMQQLFDLKQPPADTLDADLLTENSGSPFTLLNRLSQPQNSSDRKDFRVISDEKIAQQDVGTAEFDFNSPQSLQSSADQQVDPLAASDVSRDQTIGQLDQSQHPSIDASALSSIIDPIENADADLVTNGSLAAEQTSEDEPEVGQPQPADATDQNSSEVESDSASVPNWNDDAGISAERKLSLQGIQALVQDNIQDIEDSIFNRDSDGSSAVEMAGDRLSSLLRSAPGIVSANFTYLLGLARLSQERVEREQAQLQTQAAIDKKKEEQQEKSDEDFEEAMSQGNKQNQPLDQSELDSMPWEGDKNAIWAFNGKSGSRQSWYDAAKTTRRNLDKIAKDNNWSDETKKHEELLLSRYMEALKNNDQAEAQRIFMEMKKETQERLEQEQDRTRTVDSTLSVNDVATANMAADGSTASIDAGADLISALQNLIM